MQEQSQKIIVFDFGGGTFDISVLSIDGGIIEVISTRGDTHLGGQDIDEILVRHCMNDFKERHNIDLTNNLRAQARLRN